MARETSRSKAIRLLAEGRVRTITATRDHALVAVRGDSGKYLVTVDHGAALCECPAIGRNPCSHRQAALLVTLAGIDMEAAAR